MIAFRIANIGFYTAVLQLYFKVLFLVSIPFFSAKKEKNCIILKEYCLVYCAPSNGTIVRNSFIKLWFSIICHDELLCATLKIFCFTIDFISCHSFQSI